MRKHCVLLGKKLTYIQTITIALEIRPTNNINELKSETDPLSVLPIALFVTYVTIAFFFLKFFLTFLGILREFQIISYNTIKSALQRHIFMSTKSGNN